MKKPENCLEVTLVLPKNFKQKIITAMNEEFTIASNKWGLSLNTEDKKKIIKNSITQLENKVSSIAGGPWTLSDEKIVVFIGTARRGVFPITLPAKEANKHSVSFIRTHDQWKVEQDPSSEAVSINKFHKFFLEEVERWARTAVFYGVGSFG